MRVVRELRQPVRVKQERSQTRPSDASRDGVLHGVSTLSSTGPYSPANTATAPSSRHCQSSTGPHELHMNALRCITSNSPYAPGLHDISLFYPLNSITHFLPIRVKPLSIVTLMRASLNSRMKLSREATGQTSYIKQTQSRRTHRQLRSGPPAYVLLYAISASSAVRPGRCCLLSPRKLRIT